MSLPTGPKLELIEANEVREFLLFLGLPFRSHFLFFWKRILLFVSPTVVVAGGCCAVNFVPMMVLST